MKSYIWQPLQPYDSMALNRLKEHTQKPKQPMGEAWFMGDDRRMFDELLGDIESLDIEVLLSALREIVSGNSCFGHFDEWLDWFDYLLPYTMNYSNQSYAFHTYQESLITAFISCYPNQEATYRKYALFLPDVLNTLGKNVLEHFRLENNQLNFDINIEQASAEVSANMILCAKYLPNHLIKDWLNSVLNIKNHLWRLVVMNWFYAYYEVLTTGKWIGELKGYNNFDNYEFMAQWEDNHYLKGEILSEGKDFIGAENRQIILEIVNDYFKRNDFENWSNEYDNFLIETNYKYIFPEIIIENFKKTYLN